MSFRILAIAALVSTRTLASEVVLTETGDTRATAANIDAFFTLPPPEVVFSEPPFPTASLTGELSTGVDVDWVSFTGRGGQIVYVDSDHMPLLVDTALHLFSANGTLLASADDSLPIDLGSEFELDAFLGVFVLPADGTYTLAITSWTRVPATSSSSTIDLFRPDGGEGGVAIVGAQAGNDAFTGLVDPIDQNEYTVHVTLGGGACGMDVTFDSGTLRLDFGIATPDPVTWNLWLNVRTAVVPLWSVPIPALENKATFSVPIPGFPSLGTVGFLTTFTDSSEIVCSTWKTIDTTAPLSSMASRLRSERMKKRSRQ